MKNNIYIILVVLLVFSVDSYSQQDPHFSLYQYNRSVINPAYAGSSGDIESLFGVRSQWVGVADAPDTFSFNVNLPLKNKLGVGLTIVSDQVFVVSETHMYADISYKLQLSEKLDLFLGIKAGGSFLNVDLSRLSSNDALFTENVNNFNPNVGAGLYLQSNRFYVTVSAPGLLQGDRYEKQGVVPVSASDALHFFAGAGYDYPISDSFDIRPSFLARGVIGAPLSVDLSLATMYKDRFELGVNYRLEESFTGFFTVEFLERFRLGYAFEQVTTAVSQFSSGTHELVLKFILNTPKETPTINTNTFNTL